MPDEVSQSELVASNGQDQLYMTNIEGVKMDAKSPKEVGRSTMNVGNNQDAITQDETVEENLCNVSGYFRTKEDKEERETKVTYNKEDDSFFNGESPEELKENRETMDFDQDDIDNTIKKRQGEP